MVKVGLIGAGRWGQNHLRELKELHGSGSCEFVGFADSRESKTLAKEYGVTYLENYEKILPLVDAVFVVTPTNTHYEIVKRCLLEEKHVFVEKPLTMESREAKELVTVAESKQLVLAVGYQYRFNPAVIKLKEEIDKADKIHYITMRYIHSSKPPRKDMGVIFNFGAHLFDILNFLLEDPPERIFCKKVDYFSEEREDFASILLEYKDYVASLEVSWLHPLKKRDCWVITSKEKIYADFLDQNIERHFVDIGPESTVNRGFEIERIEKREPLKDELRHFIECVREGREPINGKTAGYLATNLCELALDSAKTGEEIEVKL